MRGLVLCWKSRKMGFPITAEAKKKPGKAVKTAIIRAIFVGAFSLINPDELPMVT